MQPSPQSPIGRTISKYLVESHPAGLTVSEIYDCLVAEMSYGGTRQMLLDLLAAHPDVYAKGPGGRWLDSVFVAADGGMVSTPEAPQTGIPTREQVSLATERPPQRPGRFQNSYVVFDLETLVADTLEKRRVIEISAVKCVNGVEVAKFQRFVNPGQELDAATENLTHISNAQI